MWSRAMAPVCRLGVTPPATVPLHDCVTNQELWLALPRTVRMAGTELRRRSRFKTQRTLCAVCALVFIAMEPKDHVLNAINEGLLRSVCVSSCVHRPCTCVEVRGQLRVPVLAFDSALRYTAGYPACTLLAFSCLHLPSSPGKILVQGSPTLIPGAGITHTHHPEWALTWLLGWDQATRLALCMLSDEPPQLLPFRLPMTVTNNWVKRQIIHGFYINYSL